MSFYLHAFVRLQRNITLLVFLQNSYVKYMKYGKVYTPNIDDKDDISLLYYSFE